MRWLCDPNRSERARGCLTNVKLEIEKMAAWRRLSQLSLAANDHDEAAKSALAQALGPLQSARLAPLTWDAPLRVGRKVDSTKAASKTPSLPGGSELCLAKAPDLAGRPEFGQRLLPGRRCVLPSKFRA